MREDNIFRKIKLKFLHNFENTKIFALVGSSGSGKSYSVDMLVQKYDIDLVIDDGLLIKGDKVLSGISAKQENNEMMAIRRAIFLERKHRDMIVKMIDKQYYPRILILGTSIKMIDTITQNLFLPPAYKIIRIEDIRSKEEIEYSHKIRSTQGTHIVPIPYIELKQYMRKYSDVYVDDSYLNQKTIVSPKFSRATTSFYSDIELNLLVSDIIRKKYPNAVIVSFLVDRKKNNFIIRLSIRNLLGMSYLYNSEEIKQYLNEHLPQRVEEASVENVDILS